MARHRRRSGRTSLGRDNDINSDEGSHTDPLPPLVQLYSPSRETRLTAATYGFVSIPHPALIAGGVASRNAGDDIAIDMLTPAFRALDGAYGSCCTGGLAVNNRGQSIDFPRAGKP